MTRATADAVRKEWGRLDRHQVVGDGPLDLVVIPIWVSHLEYAWEDPSLSRFYVRLASFARVILFDKRGTGLSDRVPESALPTLEQRMDDVRAVMDAAGSEQAALFGMHEGGAMSALFAATHPERTAAIVAFGMFARRLEGPGHPWGWTRERRERWLAEIERDWGGPSVSTPSRRRVRGTRDFPPGGRPTSASARARAPRSPSPA